jgi:myosin heavy subunit
LSQFFGIKFDFLSSFIVRFTVTSAGSNSNRGQIQLNKTSVYNLVTASSMGGMLDEEHRNSSLNSHGGGQIMISNNQYASDKALPLTVACHFKNSLHELIDKINKCKCYFIRCIKPNPNQENVFINEFVVKQLRYCSIMHVCRIRKCGYPYRIKFDEFLKWYKAIEVCILRKDDSDQMRDFNNNVDATLQRCLKCLEYAKVTNYKACN